MHFCTGTGSVSHRWLLRSPSGDSERLLFCIPFAGAGASAFHGWPQRLDSLEICPVQLPGKESRFSEPRPPTLSALGHVAAVALRPHLDRPFALFGHCMGAWIAHAMVEALHDIGGPLPYRLFVSAAGSPDSGFFGPVHPDMGDPAIAVHIRDHLRELGEADPPHELVELGVHALRDDLNMFLAHRAPPRRRLPCPITVVAWSRDVTVPATVLADWHRYGEVTSLTMDGGHLTVVDPPDGLYVALTGGVENGERAPAGTEVKMAGMEAALRACGNVRDAAILPVGEGAARRTIAFVVPQTGGLLPHELRRTLRRRLGGGRIPSEFVEVPRLPRLADGAPDIDALNAIVDATVRQGPGHRPPDGWVEEYVVALWEDHLPAGRIGADDDFLALGGNSLIAARLVRSIRRELNVSIELTALMGQVTPRALSRLITELGGQPKG